MTKAEKSAYDKEYRQRPEVRARERQQWETEDYKARRRKYYTSPKGRTTQARYNATPKGKEVRRKINASPSTRTAIKRWRQTPRGKAMDKATSERHAEQRKVYAKKPESKLQGWRRSLERRYNFSETEYEAMLAAQGGVCAICEEPPKRERLHVDHNHVTGQVRGLLCRRCNLTLGFWNDDPKRFARAAAYLLDKPAGPSPN